MSNQQASTEQARKRPAWREIVAKYQKPALGPGLWQLTSAIIPYVGLWYLMYLASKVSLWLAVPLAVLAAGFLVRIFIIFHDCGHGSFFRSRRANAFIGFITGIITFTPYYHWRWQHAIHH